MEGGEDRKSNIVKATPGDEGEDTVISVKLAPQDGSVPAFEVMI